MSELRERGQETLNWHIDQSIAVPSPETEARMAIRKSDWQRLKRCAQRLNKPNGGLSEARGILFGLVGSTFISIYPISIAKGLPSWVVPAYAFGTLTFFICGILCIVFDRKLERVSSSSRQDLLDDMNSIESYFQSEKHPG